MQKMKRILSIVVTVCMLVSILSTGVLAVDISEKPANGTTTGQPFAPGTGGSANFRIPGIVTLDNGTLVAVCDARWNHSADSSGLDTIVSVSTDNGETWEYTFANYLGDNGNVYNSYSSCIIDPAIGTDGTTIYLIADLFPAGMAINTSAYRAQRGSTGYDANGNLLLRSDSENGLTFGQSSYDTAAAAATYGYYLKEGAIYTTEGTLVEGYEVDAYFNITGTDGTNTNLFFGDSPYKPFPTDYLYMTTSTDGLNWSEPTLINLKAADEQTLLIGPGNGTSDPATGRMIFTAYEYDWGTQFACLVWMDENGAWHRSENATVGSHWSSEATSVVLDDGTVRMFFRDGYSNLFYTDYVYDESVGNYVVTNREVSTTAAKRYNNQLTSIRYSQQINGKDVILVSCAAYADGRNDGHLYVFLVNEDNTMELAYNYDIFPGEQEYYAYNCITEMDNGNIALLYESQGSAITYHVIDMDEVLVRENDPRLTFKQFELLTGDSKVFTDNTGYYGDDDISELDTAVAELVMTGDELVTDAAQLGSDTSYSGDIIDLADCLYTFTKGENDRWSAAALDGTVYLYPGNTSSSGYPNRDTAYANLSILAGYEDGTFSIMSNDCDNANQSTSYLYFDRSGLRWDRVSSPGTNTTWLTNTSVMLYKPVEGAGSAEIPGYERVTALADVSDGEYLVVGPGSDGNLYALYPSTSTANRYCQIAKLLGRTTVGHTELTFTGIAPGYTEVQVGSIVYQITVANLSDVAVEIPVGTTVTVTEANGNYADADTSALDTSIATVTMTGVNGTTSNGLSVEPVSQLTDGTYVILNTRANKLVTNAAATAAAAAGAGSGLSLNGTKTSVDAAAIWTITATDGGYTVQDQNGKYMTISSNNASVSDTSNTLSLNWGGTTWTIAQNGAYLNHFGGGSSTCAAGWQDTSAAADAGSQFEIYAYSEQVYGPSTELTFTGVYPGNTELTVGRTRFLITVTGDVHDVQLKTGESASFVISGDQTGADLSALNTNVATAELALVSVAHVSNGTDYNAEAIDLADCLYTFTATDDGFYEVSATAADGTTVYLNHFSSGNNNPNVTTAGKIDVQTSSHTNMFKLVAQNIDGSSASARGLHFHAEAAMPYWNRCGSDTSAKCHEYLYRPVREGEQSSAEIAGYVLVTDIAEVVDGGQYLIVHDSEVDDDLYVLHPSASTDKWTHVAKLAPSTEVTFTGVAAGETSVTLPGHIFNITVTESVCSHDWSDWTVTTEPDCTNEGLKTRTCQLCGETEEQTVEALGHDYEAVVTAPTCTEGGYTTYTCSCGDTYTADETEALGHDYQDGVCTRCGLVSLPFTDVTANQYYAESVQWAYENGIVAGMTETLFNPNGLTTRAQIVTFLWRAEGRPAPTITECPFTDVVEGSFYYDAVLWAYENGIAAGISTSLFAPNSICTRAQIVSFLWRYAGRPAAGLAENPFSDVAEGSYYHDAVLWAYESGITAGIDETHFAPEKSCTRADAVCFLHRMMTK